jgi:hypothetical protein
MTGGTVDIKPSDNSDQSKFSRGIRDLKDHEKDDGKFVEAEINTSDRRDPEESKYNEAGQPVATQAEVEKNS